MGKDVFGRVHSIETFSTLDGPGVRMVVFLQGCYLGCIYCHNPDTWNVSGGQIVKVSYVLEKVKDFFAYIESGGITVSGGEPLIQPEFCFSLLQNCKKNFGLHTAIQTAGGASISNLRYISSVLDLLILDIKGADVQCCRDICNFNVEYKSILDLFEFLGKDVWVRHVLLPGYTDKKEYISKLAELVKNYGCIKRFELLPFHKMGEYKWAELDIKYSLKSVQPPTDECIKNFVDIFQSYGIEVIY